MWDRKELKSRGKIAFKTNYWRCVLVALLLLALFGYGAASGADSAGDSWDADELVEHWGDWDRIQREFESIPRQATGLFGGGLLAGAGLIALCVDIFLLGPIEVGCRSFFFRNCEEPAALGELERAFQPQWMHNVVTMLLREIFNGLWFMLFVIPGVVKMYSYRMVPYILAEYPELSGTEVITLSRRMMNGHKWNAFVLDLSFLGWDLLSALTGGILAIFYVAPYRQCTNAELYRAISAEYYAQNGAPVLPEV